MDFHDPIPTRLTKHSVDSFAEAMFKELELKPGDDLNVLVEELGGEVSYGWTELDELSGGSITVFDYDHFRITLSEMTSRKRDRFTVAHELGHLFLHYEKVREEHGSDAIMRATREKREGDQDHERAEWEANWFAAGFLMPKTIFLEKCESLTDDQLSSYFDVSGAAVDVRKRFCGI